MAGLSLLNSGAVRELASLVVKENVVQEIMVIPYRSADFIYTEDVNAKSVSVNRVKMVNGGRTLGSATNGGYFNDNTASSESAITEIPLDNVFDKVIKVAQVQDDLSGGMALRGSLMNVPKAIGKFVNCTYFASLLANVLNTAISATSAEGTVSYAISTDYVNKMSAATSAAAIASLQSAVANLEAGDSDNGFDIFPAEESVVYANATFMNYLRGTSNFIVNNPIGQQMIGSGSFDAFDATWTPDSIKGYAGEIYGMLLYRTGSLFTAVNGFLGQKTLSDGTLAAVDTGSLDHLLAIVVCGLAIGGGMTPGDIKVVDARGGQGWEIQPLARCGFGVFSSKGIQLITDNTGLTANKFVTYTGAAAVATKTKACALYEPENRS